MVNFSKEKEKEFIGLLSNAFDNAQSFEQHKNQSKMKNLKLAIDQESVNIYIDNGDDKEPLHILYWHIDEREEDPTVIISICNAIQMFYTDKQKLIDLIK